MGKASLTEGRRNQIRRIQAEKDMINQVREDLRGHVVEGAVSSKFGSSFV